MAFPCVQTGEKERFHEELKLLDIGLEKRMTQPVRTSLRWTETGADAFHGNHESAQASASG